MMHKEAKSDEFLDVGETFWRVCPPAAYETDFLDPPVQQTVLEPERGENESAVRTGRSSLRFVNVLRMFCETKRSMKS